MKSLRLLFVLGAALAATGCIRLLPKPEEPRRIFSLEAAAPAAVRPGPAKPVVIAVNSPAATRALAGADLAWRKDGALAYVEGASWEGRGVDLLQSLLAHTIDRSGLVMGAVETGEGRADTEIRWDLLAFEINEQDGAMAAVLRAHVKLMEARTRTLLASIEIDERVPLSNRSTMVAARTLEAVARQASAKIAVWAADNTPVRVRPSPAPAKAPALEAASRPPETR